MLVRGITELISAVDIEAVDRLLRSLDDPDRRELRAWFEGSRDWFQELELAPYQRPVDAVRPVDDMQDTVARSQDLRFLEGMCAVTLLGPTTAARRVPWRRYWGFRKWDGEAAFVRTLRDKDRDWAATFVDTASAIGLGGNARNTNTTLSRILRKVVEHHDLPCPGGATFHGAWLAGSWKGSLLETLRDDPLMPNLLFHFLASGHAGGARRLPEAARTLVDEGRVDRTRLVEVVLQQLTTQQRVAGQRVLAQTLEAVDLRAGEVTGGLPFLLGVIASRHGSVGAVLLPHAIELVGTGDELLELTTVVAGRTEKKQKEVLLRSLQDKRLRRRLGVDPVLDALRLLGDGDQDVAFAAKVARARAALGDTADEAAAPVTLGLWDLRPTPPSLDDSARPHSWWKPDPERTWLLMLGHAEPDFPGHERWTLHGLLRGLENEQFDPSKLAPYARHLLVKGELHLPKVARLFEDLFLAGAMRQTWPVAVQVADDACASPRRPAGLELLLRTLAQYAPEAPAQELPAHVRALAAGSQESKAAHEARALGAASSRVTVEEYVARVRAAPVERPTAAPRGLWNAAPPIRPLPMHQRVTDREPDLSELEKLAADDNGYEYLFLRTTAEDGVLVAADLLLHDAVQLVRRHGADAVRERIRAVPQERRWPGPVGRALDLWASGRLAPGAYWTLALRARRHGDVLDEWRQDPANTPGDVRERSQAIPPLLDQLEDDAPILPASLDSRPATLTFLRACETLLRAEVGGVVLSTPTWHDGTLELDDLVDRLSVSPSGTVGPLDLLQALYRLRPAGSARAAEIAFDALRTVPDLTTPDGDEAWDATELVRTWLAAGGLPPLGAHPSADGETWTTEATPPILWDACRAAPRGLHDELLGASAATGALVRVFPRWPDVALFGRPFAVRPYDDVEFARGLMRLGDPLGLPAHEYLLGSLIRADDRRTREAIAAAVELARHERLDPDVAVTAALGRHQAGTLRLPTLVKALEQVFERGGLKGWWPVALTLVAGLSSAAPKPVGLPDLLKLLSTYAHEVPEPTVPESLRSFADARGSSRSHVEARALVGLLDSGSER